MRSEMNLLAETEGRSMLGKVRYDAFDFFEEAKLEDGQWLLTCSADGADELAIYFNDFHIPVGGKLRLHNSSGQEVGVYRTEENNAHAQFMTDLVEGDALTLIYEQGSETQGVPHLGIMGCGYVVHQGGGSDPCQVDVNCPEGEDWQCQRDAVVHLIITAEGNMYNCSGSLVNTTAFDCRQYLLTALHCAWNVQDDEWAFLQVRFNYEVPFLDENNDGIPEWSSCGSGAPVETHNRVGVVKLADSDDYIQGQGTQGSDFLLLEVEDAIPDEWDPYFAGWDASGWGSSTGVSIHHPSGDAKKISTYGTALQSIWIGYPNSHWEVTWQETSNGYGVTEPGSSGSPIFNFEHRIIGTLTGGTSACEVGGAGAGTGPNEPDWYGKMNQHWTNNDNTPEQKLKAWLDPLNTGQQTTYGAYRPCDEGASCEIVGVGENQSLSFNLFPNPSEGNVTIEADQLRGVLDIQVIDPLGKVVYTADLNNQGTQFVDLSALPQGVYHVVILDQGVALANEKLVLVR